MVRACVNAVVEERVEPMPETDLLHELLAKQAIQEVMCTYCRSLDRMDRKLASTVWHPGGTADFPGFYTGTGEGLLDFVWEMHAGLLGHAHHVTNVLIELLAPDRAVSESYTIVVLRPPVEGDRSSAYLLSVRYVDRWSQRDGTWAIDSRLGIGDFGTMIDGPAMPGMDVASAPSRRDPDDPSYGVFATRFRGVSEV
jgi:hypothetical protein